MSGYEKAVAQMKANAQQWKAFESTGSCVTLAGPGSGKTKVLTTKMARILREDVRAPRHVACVTFNNECARELERRLSLVGVVGGPNVFVGTLHSFCLAHVLRPLAALGKIKIPKPVLIASQSMQTSLFHQAMAVVRVNAEGFRTDFDRFRRTAIDRTEGVDGWEVGDRGLTDVCLEYERLLREAGRLDYDDIVLLSARAIETSETIRHCVSARFPVLLVDEYQDLGVPLHRIVTSLCFNAGVRIFAVGDPDQSIYGFTGARPDLLRNLANRQELERVDLRTNYRSARRIVAASEFALGEERSYAAKSEEEGYVGFTYCPNGLSAQVECVVKTLIPILISKGDALGDIAILYPTQQEGDAAEMRLMADKIPFVRVDRGAGYRRTPLVRLVEEFAAWCCGGGRDGTVSLSSLLKKWEFILASSDRSQAARRSLVRFLFNHRDADGLCGAWLIAFAPIFNEHAATIDEDERDAFAEILSATSEHGPLGRLELRAFAGTSGSANHICLMNLHTAKGTEFNAVILIGLDDGRMPLYRASSANDLAEQRRLFFVGISRARREVHLFYSGFTENRYGRRFDKGPSPFLLEVQRKMSA